MNRIEKRTLVRCLYVFLTALSLILLSGCGDEDVFFTRTDDGTDPGKLEFLVENRTGWKIQFVDYELQEERDGDWVQMIPPRFGFSTVNARQIKNGQSAVIAINARYLYGGLEPGDYMVRGQYKCYHPFRMTDFYPMNCVFTITEEESAEIAKAVAADEAAEEAMEAAAKDAVETAETVPAESS